MTRLLKAKSLVLAAMLAFAGSASAQHFMIDGADIATPGHPPSITLADLPPDAEVEIRARRALKNYFMPGAPILPYQSAARFRAGEDGRVDLAISPAIEGSYAGADPIGLFWSMQPVGQEPVDADDTVYLDAFIDGQGVASATFELPVQPLAEYDVVEVTPLPGSYFIPHPGPGERPVIIMVEGPDSFGMNRDVIMPQLVAAGYSVMHFATWSLTYGPMPPDVEGLPTRYVDIPIDRLQEAHDWVVQQPGVDEDRIGLYGFSRNGAYVLLAATRFPWVQAVAGIAPADVVYEGWGDGVQLGTTSSYSWQGEPLPYVPYSDSWFRETAKFARGEIGRLRTPMDEGRWANPDRVAAARIPIETYRGPLLVAGSEQDQIWSAGHAVQNIAERRAEAGLETTLLVFPDAGHNIIGNGWYPVLLLEQGDTRGVQAQAQYQTWRGTLDFFDQALRPNSPQ